MEFPRSVVQQHDLDRCRTMIDAPQFGQIRNAFPNHPIRVSFVSANHDLSYLLFSREPVERFSTRSHKDLFYQSRPELQNLKSDVPDFLT